MSEAVVILCTCPDEDTAGRLATGLVEDRLAACVNVLPGVRSIYRWQGEVQDDAEVLMVIKTTAASVTGLQTWLREAHPYDVPEIIALPVTAGSAEYLEWVAGSVAS